MVTKSKNAAGKQKRAVTTKPPGEAQPVNGSGASPSNQDVLRQLYASMLKCRVLAERAQGLGSGKHAYGYDFDIGQEAMVVGASVELESQDSMVASSRDFAAHVSRGVSLQSLLSGAATNGGGHAVVVTDPSPPQAAGCDAFNLGTGLALTHKLEKKRNVVMALCSKEVPDPDRWHEALKFAGIHKLPIIYVKSSSAFERAPEERTPALEGLSFMARDCGFPAIVVDGKDAVAVWRVVHESIHRARNGAGPTLIECETRVSSAGDPLAHMEHYLKKRGLWDDQWRRDTANRIDAESKSPR